MTLFRSLFVLLVIFPILEIYVLIQVGSAIGTWYTILLVILTAVIGARLLSRQGMLAIHNVQHDIQHGQVPAVSLLAGMLLFVAGAFLLTPGFITDSIGLILLIPAVRTALARGFLKRSVVTYIETHQQVYRSGPRPGPEKKDSKTIEGECERRDD
jgi:UPF0716 protein FxsA